MLFQCVQQNHEPRKSAFVSDGQFKLGEGIANGFKSHVLWWLITFFMQSLILLKATKQTQWIHPGLFQVFIPTANDFDTITLGSFSLSGKRMEFTIALKYKEFFLL